MGGIGEIAAIAGIVGTVIGAGTSIYTAATASSPSLSVKPPSSTLAPLPPEAPPVVPNKTPERDAQKDAAEERRRLVLRKRLNAPASNVSLTTPSVLGN